MRNTSATPERVPVRFPAFLKIAKPLAALGPELLRIHLLAGRAESVLVIAGSIGVSAAILALVAHGVSWSSLRPTSLMDAAPSIIMSETWSSLAVVLTAWILWWSVIGGAMTRRMALAIVGDAPEPWRASLCWCTRPAKLVPSALASLCLLALAVGAVWPCFLLALPPVWLIAGVLYAGLCLPPGRLEVALTKLFA